MYLTCLYSDTFLLCHEAVTPDLCQSSITCLSLPPPPPLPSNLLLSPLTAIYSLPALTCISDLSFTHLPLRHRLAPTLSDVAVQLPDKKSIIMYVTSLFAVLPKDVSMEAIKEVETLPRKYKVESEDTGPGLSAQVKCTTM